MRILLIRPHLDTFGALRRIGGLYEPVNLMALAAYLKREGHFVTVADYEADPDRLGRLGTELSSGKIDAVGLTAMTPSYPSAQAIARRVKELAPTLPLILGGIHASLLPEEVLQETPEIDYVVRGEGEQTLTELLNQLPDPSPAALRTIDGLTYRLATEVVHNGPRKLFTNLGGLPHPDRSVIDHTRYRGALSPGLYRNEHNRFAEIFTSRGCPYRCTFCSVRKLMGQRWRKRPLGDVLAEVDDVTGRLGCNFILFHDDNLTISKERTLALCEGMQARGVRWACLSRVDTVDEELIRRMAAAGCQRIYFGVESGSPRVLRSIGKNITPEQTIRAFDLTRRYGITSQAYVTVGQPDETVADIRQTIGLLHRIRPDFLFVSIVVPYPGTQPYDDAVAKGYLRPGDWTGYLYFDRPVARTDHLTRAELDRWQKRVLMAYILRWPYLWDRLRSLRSPDDLRYYLGAGASFLRYVAKPFLGSPRVGPGA